MVFNEMLKYIYCFGVCDGILFVVYDFVIER